MLRLMRVQWSMRARWWWRRGRGGRPKVVFAVTESPNGIDNFRFWDYPYPDAGDADPDVNVYDIRVVRHEDGWIYGLFCTERKDPEAPAYDTSSPLRSVDLRVRGI